MTDENTERHDGPWQTQAAPAQMASIPAPDDDGFLSRLAAPMTLGMIAVNVAIYAVMAALSGKLSFPAEMVVHWGGNFGPLTLGGEPWRLFTSTFLHFGPGHIASNMLCLFYWGVVTERPLGWWRWLLAYLACGLIASGSSVLVHGDVVSAGASGAIAGLLGVIAAMFLKRYPAINGRVIVQNLLLNVVIAVVLPVDWVAHLGGFLAGVALGMVLLPRAPPRPFLP